MQLFKGFANENVLDDIFKAVESALYRTRTYDPLIKSQLLCQLS